MRTSKQGAQTIEKSAVCVVDKAASVAPYSVKFIDYGTVIRHFRFAECFLRSQVFNKPNKCEIYLYRAINNVSQKSYVLYRKLDESDNNNDNKYLNLGPYNKDCDEFRILTDNFHNPPEELIKYTILDKISDVDFNKLKLYRTGTLTNRNGSGENFGLYSDKSKVLVFYKCPYFYVYMGIYVNDEKWEDLINDFNKGRTIQELMMYADLDSMR